MSPPLRDLMKGVLIGMTISCTSIYLLRHHQRQKVQSKQKHDTSSNTFTANKSQENNTNDSISETKKIAKSIPKSLRSELISRTALYFPETINTHITQSSIIVLGCGGVGSHAAISLARSGVKHLRLIDMDMVTLSSLNRHACATLSDVGISKVETVKRTIERICGGVEYCTVDTRCEMYTAERTDLLDYNEIHLSPDPQKQKDLQQQGRWDFVVDAIDDVPTKTALLAECYKRNIHVVSCMGAGGKADPTRLHIGDLNNANRDPLAAKIRNRLNQIDTKIASSDMITAVFSSEKVVMKLADFTEKQKEEGVHNFGAIDGMRVRVLPVLGSMPAIMGQACAAFALCQIGNKPFTPIPGERLSKSVRHRAFQHFCNREKYIRKIFEQNIDIPIDTNTNDSANIELTKNNKRKDEKPNYGNSHLIRKTKVLSNNHNNGDDNQVWVGTPQIDMDDIEFLMSTQWRQKCGITAAKLGTVLELVRWDMGKPSTLDNIVLMAIKSIRMFDESGWDTNIFGNEVKEMIEKRLAIARDVGE